METNIIYNEDCLVTLRSMDDKCCDVFADPPYNVGKDYGDYNDKMTPENYTEWIVKVLTELKRVSNVLTIYVPKKWNLLYWNTLGTEFQEIILPFRPAGALRYGFSNQFNKLLTNARPKKDKPILNVWDNMQQPGLGFFFREETYGHPGYTSEAITRRVINELCESDIIYDPFMGTGTTAVAAIGFKKEFIGSELNQDYINIANRRIKLHLSQPCLF
jgi:DNA modification methylase